MNTLKEKKVRLEQDIEKLLNDFAKEFPEISELEVSTRNHFNSGKLIHLTSKVSVRV